MRQPEILHKLIVNHEAFLNYIISLTDHEFLQNKDGKWSAGQQLEHLYLSIKPITQILSLPKSKITERFGSASRQSLSYDQLVSNYLNLIANGAKATGQFLPKPVSIEMRESLLKVFSDKVEQLELQIKQLSEQDLDEIILPHPLLGDLTLREMLFFTALHVEHHHKSTERNNNEA